DSNSEDLPDFSGAGLFDSVPNRVSSVPNSVSSVSYRAERLVTDPSFAEDMMRKIAEASVAVEKAMGGVPQDIEGCWVGGEVHIVQTRPQVGLDE
ncbi:hypothetical protein T484DRAFT_1821617, partial [Baffinella frigidus]